MLKGGWEAGRSVSPMDDKCREYQQLTKQTGLVAGHGRARCQVRIVLPCHMHQPLTVCDRYNNLKPVRLGMILLACWVTY